MTDGRDVEEWVTHAEELLSQDPVRFENGEVVACPVGPAVEALQWLRRQTSPGRVLDLGCNVGLFSGLFEDMQYVGLDQRREIVKHNPHPAVVGNGRHLPFAEHSFDMVFTRAVLQHNCLGDDKDDIIREMYRVLKPGGYYLCYEGSLLSHTEWPEGFDPQGTKEAIDWFGPLGFELLEHPAPPLYLFQKAD